MSVTLMAQVYATKLGNATLKAVALKLADYANDEGGNIWPALDTVALHTETSKSTVQRALKALLDMGVLEVEREGGRGQGSTTRYRLCLGKLASSPKLVKVTTNKVVKMTTLENSKVVTDDNLGGHRDHRSVKEPSRDKPQKTIVDATSFMDGKGSSQIPFDGTDDESPPFPEYRVADALSGEGTFAQKIARVVDAGREAFPDPAERKRRRAPFTADALHRIKRLWPDLDGLIERYYTKTAGKKVRDPSAYLMRMAQDERAKLDGVTVEQLAKITSVDPVTKAAAMAQAVGAKPAPPEWMKRLPVNTDRASLGRLLRPATRMPA